MKVLVTGGAGFIGSHLVDKLLTLGFEVVVVDNLSTGKKKNINPRAKFYKTDIRSDALDEVFTQETPDTVFHLAAQTNIMTSIKNPKEDYSINVEGTLNLLKSSQELRVKRFIFSSTVAVYGEPRYFPTDERHPTNPINPYGENKLATEKYVESFAQKSEFEFTILRYANVYGPRQTRSSKAAVITIFLDKMKRGESVEIFGDGTQERDFVYVGDVVQATVSAMKKGSGEILNIGTGNGVNINELFGLLCQLCRYRKQPLYEDKRVEEIYKSIVNPERAREVLDWQAETTLKRGLELTTDGD